MLVLSLFPGIGLLDRAFEEEGFCVVRGPDLLWGGNIKAFHPPAGKFDGVIGGSPCQAFSAFAPLILATGGTLAENLIPEFERCVKEALPSWFLHENVKGAPIPQIAGYQSHGELFNARWIGDEQSRLHRMTLGIRVGRQISTSWQACLAAETVALENARFSPRVLANGGYLPLIEHGKRRELRGKRMRDLGYKNTAYFRSARRLQGLSDTWDLPGFTVAAKIKALGNAVPLPMGRAVARAVKRAVDL